MSFDHSNGKMENSESEVSSSQAPESGEQPDHEESRLLKAMNYAISEQNVAFCCGGQVPIIATADEGKEHRFDDVAGMITCPLVVLRWDLPSGMYILCETFVLCHGFSFESVSRSKEDV